MAFCWPCKAALVHYKACGVTGSTNQNWWGARRLLMDILIYLWFVHIPVAYWEHSTTVCGLIAGRAHLQQAHPPTPITLLPPTHLLISNIPDIIGVLKNQQWILHGRVGYETLAISMLYLYSKFYVANGYNVAEENHSCFNISKRYFLKYKWDNLVGFCKSSHK